MKFSIKVSLWVNALTTVFGMQSWADTVGPSKFEAGAFLTACTELVPDVPLAIPMDAQCISQGRKMCELAAFDAPPETCLLEVTRWMQNEVALKWSLIPDDIRLDHAEPPTAEEMVNDGMLASLSSMMPSCETVQIDGVSKGALCEYTNALAGWHALRVLQRSASETNQ
ncbi:hypothetical protein [Ruegeria lacuscaerulensis]|uniref:hypothetical protein n=1 Tax=Ruegeria lacuscaerulensis TaxID=55218 RepID=UPI00147FE0C7|nr:hypothetical protein [Ruegeria lacuscaerulensis]